MIPEDLDEKIELVKSQVMTQYLHWQKSIQYGAVCVSHLSF